MEFVEDKEMYLIIQDNQFNRKYHNYKLGDECDCLKKHNEKYVNFKKAKRKLFKTQREKKLVFMESLHEKVRKSVNSELPSRLSSIILYDNLEDCYKLEEKWKKNTGLASLGIFKVKCEGKLHACATTPDEKKSEELTKKAHIAGITRFWQGDETAKTKEYFFQGKAIITEVLKRSTNMKDKNVVYHGSRTNGLKRLEPFKCKHDRPYVYATKYYWVMLFFSAKGQGKFDGWIKTDKKGIPTFYEARPNAFKERYSGQSSYCYHLPADTFTNATGDPTEVVSEVGVDVLFCEEIKDVGAEYDKLIKDNKFKVVAYNTSNLNTEKICNEYILKILTQKGYFTGKDFRQKEWASEYYKDLIEKYSNIKHK